MWDLPGPVLEPVSSALAGGFLTTVHQGSPYSEIFDVATFLNGIWPILKISLLILVEHNSYRVLNFENLDLGYLYSRTLSSFSHLFEN